MHALDSRSIAFAIFSILAAFATYTVASSPSDARSTLAFEASFASIAIVCVLLGARIIAGVEAVAALLLIVTKKRDHEIEASSEASNASREGAAAIVLFFLFIIGQVIAFTAWPSRVRPNAPPAVLITVTHCLFVAAALIGFGLFGILTRKGPRALLSVAAIVNAIAFQFVAFDSGGAIENRSGAIFAAILITLAVAIAYAAGRSSTASGLLHEST
jgi:NADH:ubiquinone oxidoreductase subunit K/NADH:ubiquinone oxidoreductase subunit 6 (subunit J)